MLKKKKKNGKETQSVSHIEYSLAFKLKVVKLYQEEQYTRGMLSEEFGVSRDSVTNWNKLYQQYGEAGLRPVAGRTVSGSIPRTGRSGGLNPSAEAIRTKIIEHKQSNPDHGILRIAQFFRRMLFLRVPEETVRQTLISAKLNSPPPKAKPKNDSKPRFFERATPNQMWQTDIMTFRLAGQNAYLIGFMDDYSRYLVSLGAYRSQSAENVIETFRQGLGEYGIPRELLSDNGRQYHNWRGVTRFEKLLETHRIKHIRSSPHHPMTLGKIERFWQTIQQEFLFKTQFDSFESFRERLALWAKYYNFKRPSQGIGGMCPADRFFEIQNDLRKAMERGIEENVQELALRGKVKTPFYMVGRMGGQNVAILAEKGKLRMHLDGEPGTPEGREQEFVLDVAPEPELAPESVTPVEVPAEMQDRSLPETGAQLQEADDEEK